MRLARFALIALAVLLGLAGVADIGRGLPSYPEGLSGQAGSLLAGNGLLNVGLLCGFLALLLPRPRDGPSGQPPDQFLGDQPRCLG